MESEIFAYENKGVIGYSAVFCSEIRALFVHPNSRRKSIGTKLLEHLLTIVETPAPLYVAKTNQPARKFYIKYGFKIVEEFKATYNGKNVLANKMVLTKKN